MNNYQENAEEPNRIENWNYQPVNIIINESEIINDIKRLIARRELTPPI